MLGQKTIDSSSGSGTSTGTAGNYMYCIRLEEDHSVTAAGLPDGIFGEGLAETLKKVQTEIGLSPTGMLNAETRTVLNGRGFETEKRSKRSEIWFVKSVIRGLFVGLK